MKDRLERLVRRILDTSDVKIIVDKSGKVKVKNVRVRNQLLRDVMQSSIFSNLNSMCNKKEYTIYVKAIREKGENAQK